MPYGKKKVFHMHICSICIEEREMIPEGADG